MFKRTRLELAAFTACFLLLSSASYAHEESQGGTLPLNPQASIIVPGMQQCMKMMSSTGDADLDFTRNMIQHHQMAIDMARKELEQGKDGQARDMAEKVIEDQSKEIEAMKTWLNNKEKRK